MVPYRTSPSRHLVMLRRAGSVATLAATLAAAVFIAVVSSASAGREVAHAGPGQHRAAAERPLQVADATFVRRDVVRRDTVATAGEGCGVACALRGNTVVRTSRERYWSRAPEAPRCAADACVR